MDIDIESEIEFEAERQFSFDQDMYDFDISAVTVTVKGFRLLGQPNIRPKRLLVIDKIDRSNCGTVEQSVSFPAYSDQHTESFSVTFGGKVSWSSQLTGSLTIPGGLSIGANRTQSVDLTASTTHSSSNQKTVTYAADTVRIPPCKRMRASREIWATEISGRVAVDIQISGNVSYSVDIDNWPDPEYDMDLNFTTTLTGTYSGVGGHMTRGPFQESPAIGCNPPCRVQTANAVMVSPGQPYLASSNMVATGLGFRSKIALEGVAGATLEQPFGFEEHPELPLMVYVAVIPDLQGFDEVVGKSTMRVPLVGIAGSRKLRIPVTCHVPGELLGIEADTVPLSVIQPIKLEMLAA